MARARIRRQAPGAQMNGAGVFTLGKFTVRLGLRADNPALPLFLISIGERFIGKQVSHPCLSDCEWHERSHGVYAAQSHSTHAGLEKRRKPGPGGPGRPRKYAYGPG